jgi:hypothetical protein
MPAWLMRLVWRVKGKRRARLHLIDNQPSVEGILAGRWGGHYVVLTPTLLADGEMPVSGHVEVPAEKVLLVQVLDK